MAEPKRRTAADYRARRNLVPTGAPKARVSTPARIIIYGFLGFVAVLVLVILGQHVVGVMRERAAAEKRALPAAAAAREALFARIRDKIDIEAIGVGSVDLRSPEGLLLVDDDPRIRAALADINVVGPGELFLHRKRVGAALVYQMDDEKLEEINAVLDFLAQADYPEEELTAALEAMVQDGRLVWFIVDHTPEPLPEEEGDEKADEPAEETAGQEPPQAPE